MLSNISVPIEKIVSEFIQDEKKAQDITNFLKLYKSRSWIYPGVLKRRYGINIIDVYKFLGGLEEAGYIKGYYEIYCGTCNRHSGVEEVFETLASIPETIECENCGSEILSLRNAILIYKVLGEK